MNGMHRNAGLAVAASFAFAAAAQDLDGYWPGVQRPGDAGYGLDSRQSSTRWREPERAVRYIDARSPPPRIERYDERFSAPYSSAAEPFAIQSYEALLGTWPEYDADDEPTPDYLADREPLLDVTPDLYQDPWDDMRGHDEPYGDIW